MTKVRGASAIGVTLLADVIGVGYFVARARPRARGGRAETLSSEKLAQGEGAAAASARLRAERDIAARTFGNELGVKAEAAGADWARSASACTRAAATRSSRSNKASA